MRTTPPGFSLKKRIAENPEYVSRGRIFDFLHRHVPLHAYGPQQHKNQTILQRSGLFETSRAWLRRFPKKPGGACRAAGSRAAHGTPHMGTGSRLRVIEASTISPQGG